MITSIASAQTQMVGRNANQNGRELETTHRQLSGHKRITRAADDSARLAIATKIDAQTRGKNQAIRNTNDAVSIIQMAEGGISDVSSMVTRLRELAMQSASGTMSSSERQMIQLESSAVIDEIGRVSGTSALFGHKLLGGKSKKLDFQIDSGATGHSRLSLDLSELDQRPEALGISNVNLATQNGAQQALQSIDRAHTKVSGIASKLGSYQKRFNSTHDKLGSDVANNKSAYSRLIDTDYAESTAKMVTQNIKQSASSGVISQLHGDLKQAVRLIG